jgi:hypothetical protein
MIGDRFEPVILSELIPELHLETPPLLLIAVAVLAPGTHRAPYLGWRCGGRFYILDTTCHGRMGAEERG